MDAQKNQVVLVKKPTLATRFKQAAVVAGATVVSGYAMAESSIPTDGLTGEIDGAKTVVLALMGAGLVLLGIFAGYRYLKRGANSA